MSVVTSIRVWEPSNHRRTNWPVTISVPFAEGVVKLPRQVVVRDPRSGQIPLQRRVLATWPDGSVKWLLLDFSIDLDPLEEMHLSVEVETEPVGVDARDAVRIEWAGDRLQVDTGPMSFELCATAGGLLQNLTADGISYASKPGTVEVRLPDGRKLDMSTGPARISIEESGPQRSVICVRGKHGSKKDDPALDYVLRFTVYAHQSMLKLHYTMINKETDPFPVSSVQMIQPVELNDGPRWGYVGTDKQKYTMPEGWISMTTEGLETRVTDGHRQSDNLNTIRAEVPMEPFMVLGDDKRMVLMFPRWAHFLYPKALHYFGGDLRYDLWPDTAGTWDFRRGMAKTHEVVLRFAAAADSYNACMPEVAPVLRPLVPTLPPEYIAETRVLPFFFPGRPDQYPLLETGYESLWEGTSRAYGMLHFGDAPSMNYTAQGRGRSGDEEALVWVNNEYDMPFMAMHQFLRTGNRNVWLSTVEPHIWHMMDVDTMHCNPDRPTDEGGQVLHLANHVGPPGYKVDPSHEWCEGLILYHLLTGSEHAREHALAMGNHLVAWTEEYAERLSQDTLASRVSGWAITALAALYEFTHDDIYLNAALAHAKGIEDRVSGETGYLTETVSYGFPYRAGFMTCITVNGLKRVWDLTGDDHWKELSLRLIDDQLEHLELPTGLLKYKQLPENHFPHISSFDLETMTYAWQWTRDKKYLKLAVRLFRVMDIWKRGGIMAGVFLQEAPEGALYPEVKFVTRDAQYMLDYRFELPFLQLMHELDLLKEFEPEEINLDGID